MINVKRFIKLLKQCNPNATVCLSKDPEGNRTHDFFEMQYDDKNIYLMPAESANKHWENMVSEIRREIWGMSSK